MNLIKMFKVLGLLAPFFWGLTGRAAEFEVLDRFSVDGYTVLKGSADIPGGSFTVGGSTLVVKNGNVGIGTANPQGKLSVLGTAGSGDLEFGSGSGSTYVQAYDRGTSAYKPIRFIATDFRFETSGTEKARIDASGNIGIGTTNPSGILNVAGVSGGGGYYFDVYHTGSSYPNLYFRKSESNTLGTLTQTSGGYGLGGIFFQGVNAGGTRGSAAAIYAVQNGAAGTSTIPTKLYLNTNDASGGANSVVMDSSGNVGIGTTGPAAKLDVVGANIAGTSQAGGNLFIRTNDSYAADKGGMLSLGGNSNLPGGTVVPFASIAGRKTNGTAEHPSGYFTISTFKADYGHLERLRIDSDGNVGIGTTNPSTALTISKPIDSAAYGSGTQMIDFKSFYPGYDVDTVKASIYSGVSSQGSLNTRGGYLAFITANNGTLGERMRIEKDGSVGIGISAPIYLLDVQGTGSTTMRIQSNTSSLNYLDIFNTNTGTTSNGSIIRLITENASGTGNAVIDMVKYASGGFYINNSETTIGAGIGFGINGTERMHIDSSGSIGIGTAAPAAKLEVQSSQGSILVASTSPNPGAYLIIPYQKDGTYTSAISITIAATSYKSFVYDIKIGCAYGGAHTTGYGYDNGGVTITNDINNASGSVGTPTISAPTSQGIMWRYPINSSCIHPLVVFQIGMGGGYTPRAGDVTITIN